MTLSSTGNKAAAGSMSDGTIRVFSHTTTTANYEVVGTIRVSGMVAHFHSVTLTAAAPAFLKIEGTLDGTNYVTLVEDFPLAKSATTQFAHVSGFINIRMSIKRDGAVNAVATYTYLCRTSTVEHEYRAAFAYESLTITNAVEVGLTQATYDAAYSALITVENNPIRFRIDGTAPTTTEGHLLNAGDSVHLDFSADIFKFKAIATGANAILRVTYSR